jgi:hypothetical protein
MDGSLFDHLFDFLHDAGTQFHDTGELADALTAGGLDASHLETIDLEKLLTALSENVDLPQAAGDWEYWGNGTYWERGPDGGYTGNSFGW